MRLCFGTVLPIVMITVGMCIQKSTTQQQQEAALAEEHALEEATPEAEEAPRVPQRLLNLALLNRSCGPRLVAHWAREPSSGRSLAALDSSALAGMRLVVGAGFVASGLNSLSEVMFRVPGACKPSRSVVGFWTSLGGGGGGSGHGSSSSRRDVAIAGMDEDDIVGSSSSGGGGGGGVSGAGWQLPPEASTRQRYLHAVGYSNSGGGGGGSGQCSIAWELTERYTNVGVRHFFPSSVCTPLVIRHYFPQARVVLMLADPIRRAHSQQTQWLHTRCFRDAREAASARRGNRGRLAKGAAPGCERLDASSQLRLELTCVRGCRLRPDSSAEALQKCAMTCGRTLRSALACKSNCPYLSLINSHFALVAPLWLRSFPCEQLLLVDGAAFFAAASGASAASKADRDATTSASPRRRTRLRQRLVGKREPPSSPSPPPPPPPPPPLALTTAPLLSLLRFVGAPTKNGTHASFLLQRYQLGAPGFGTESNPIEPKLLAELEAYFAPFQAQLRKTLAAHRKCAAERLSSAGALSKLQKEGKKPGMQRAALARAG